MRRAKQTKQTGAKATLDHVTGSTGRDGAFDFASRTELLGKLGDRPKRGDTTPDVDTFKKNAEQCARRASHATEAGVRASYEELARSWRELAHHAEELSKGGR